MTVLIDPPEAIRQLLYSNWSLHGNLDRDHVDFNTGVVAASRRYPSIEVVPAHTDTTPLTVEWWRQSPIVFIHVWERPRSTEKDALNQAKNRRNRIVNEIYDILIRTQTSAKDLEWIHPENEVNVDQYTALDTDEYSGELGDSGQSTLYPLLHTVIPVRGLRWRNRTLGGIPANR